MRCPSCLKVDSDNVGECKVIGTLNEVVDLHIRRRRHCPNCNYDFATYEIPRGHYLFDQIDKEHKALSKIISAKVRKDEEDAAIELEEKEAHKVSEAARIETIIDNVRG